MINSFEVVSPQFPPSPNPTPKPIPVISNATREMEIGEI